MSQLCTAHEIERVQRARVSSQTDRLCAQRVQTAGQVAAKRMQQPSARRTRLHVQRVAAHQIHIVPARVRADAANVIAKHVGTVVAFAVAHLVAADDGAAERARTKPRRDALRERARYWPIQASPSYIIIAVVVFIVVAASLCSEFFLYLYRETILTVLWFCYDYYHPLWWQCTMVQ